MPALERVLILYAGDEPSADEVGAIVRHLEQSTETDFKGVRIAVSGGEGGMLDETIAQFVVLRHEHDGDLSPGALDRTTIQTLTVNGAQRVVAVVKAAERSPWVREVIMKHLEKVDQSGSAVAWRPGWATLASERAISFVACAQDGEVRQFTDVLIMVSLFPEFDPERISALMPGGYINRVNEIATAAGLRRTGDETDVAHWLVCEAPIGKSVHLGYFDMSSDKTLLPLDVLSPQEQRRFLRKV